MIGTIRPDWDAYFLGLAAAAAARADCTRRQVGAVLVADRRVIATGYNGAEAGAPGCAANGACPRGKATYDEVPAFSDYGNCIAIHAEVNALQQAGPAAAGATCYTTCPPCPDCTRALAAAGVTHTVWPGKELP